MRISAIRHDRDAGNAVLHKCVRPHLHIYTRTGQQLYRRLGRPALRPILDGGMEGDISEDLIWTMKRLPRRSAWTRCPGRRHGRPAPPRHAEGAHGVRGRVTRRGRQRRIRRARHRPRRRRSGGVLRLGQPPRRRRTPQGPRGDRGGRRRPRRRRWPSRRRGGRRGRGVGPGGGRREDGRGPGGRADVPARPPRRAARTRRRRRGAGFGSGHRGGRPNERGRGARGDRRHLLRGLVRPAREPADPRAGRAPRPGGLPPHRAQLLREAGDEALPLDRGVLPRRPGARPGRSTGTWGGRPRHPRGRRPRRRGGAHAGRRGGTRGAVAR